MERGRLVARNLPRRVCIRRELNATFVNKPTGIANGQVPVWDSTQSKFIAGAGGSGGGGAVSSVVGQTGTVTGAQIIADTSVAAALAVKAPLASPTFTGTVSGVSAAMVGLGNVNDTSDAAKPVSTAQQAALDAKAPLASPTFTGTVSGVTRSMVGLGSVDNTADADKPVSTPQAAALAAKTTVVPKWTANTPYTAGDKVVSPSGDIVSAIATFTSGTSYSAANWSFSPNVVTKPSTIQDGQVPVWQASTSTWVSGLATKVITASGDTTGATDTPVIQAAIDAATAAGGGKVLLDGTYWINAALTLKSGVFLIGYGWSRSIVNLATGANSRMVELPSTTPSPIYFGIQDIKFDGYKENQTAGDAAIYVNLGTAPAGISGCTVPFFQRVMVQYAWGHGFYIGTAVEGRFYDLYAYRCGNNGIYAGGSSDRWFVQCTAGQNKNAGIFLAGGNGDRFHACKSWESGKQAARGVQSPSTVTATAPNYDLAGRNHRFIDCEAQDAPAEGFIIRTKNSQFTIHSDANDGAHIRLQGAQGNDIRLLCGDGTSHGTTADAVVNVWDTATIQNIVRATFDTYGNMTAQAIQGGGISDNNDFIIGTPDALYTSVYAATITPDPVKGYVGVTLTGNVTIANTATDRKVPRMEFDVWLTQDATGGKTVAWGTDYLGVSAADTTANKVNRWRFRCRGTKWYQVSYSVY